jgi:hypothetical protein
LWQLSSKWLIEKCFLVLQKIFFMFCGIGELANATIVHTKDQGSNLAQTKNIF